MGLSIGELAAIFQAATFIAPTGLVIYGVPVTIYGNIITIYGQ